MAFREREGFVAKSPAQIRVAATIGTFALAACLAGAANTAPHGAMDMQAQQQRLDQLLAHTDPLHPANVDSRIWFEIVNTRGNALTPQRIALGRKLFYDPRLSADGTVSCGTCHDVSRGFSNARNVAEGIRDQLGKRRSPTVMNAALFQTQFWDGRAPSLEEQAKLPELNPVEMGQPNGEAVVKAIADDPQYVAMFKNAYERAPNYADVGRAIASFERTLIFLDSPFDRWQAGDDNAISEAAKRGFDLFNNKARCASCHMINASNPIGTDNRFHNVGVSARHQNFEALANQALSILQGKQGKAGLDAVDRLALTTDMSELGRFMVTKQREDIGAFKTEQLRNVGITAPYMHDGTMQTLWDVMDHYNRGGEANAYLDGGIEPLALSEQEIDDVVAFLFTLTDRRFATENEAAYAAQKARAATIRPFRDEALAQRRVLPFELRVFGKPTLR
jgi:cytochrome c peroxidase